MIFLFLAFTLLILSCNKTEDEYIYPVSIKAGQISGTGIRYVDIVPDDSLLGYYPNPAPESKYLDLDGDSINDFELIHTNSDPGIMSFRSYQLNIKPLGLNEVCITISKNNWVDSLKYNDTIDNTNNWSNSTSWLYHYGLQTYTVPEFSYTESLEGYWYNNDSIYIGVKILKDNNQLFGWIDMKRNTIRQYAITMPYR